MNKISGKELNLLKTLEILKSNRFVSFYHFNNLSKREWDTIKQKLRKIETQENPVNENLQGNKEKRFRTIVSPLSNLEKVASNSNNKGVTTKRGLKLAEVELLVLKSKAVVKNLYPLLFYSQSCQGVEQTGRNCPDPLGVEQRESKPLGATVPTQILKKNCANYGTTAQGLLCTQMVLKEKDSHLPTESETYLMRSERSANNQLGSPLNPTLYKRINSITKNFYLIQGPTLLVGASTIKGFKESARQLEKEKSLVFVGGVLENQFINHLDLKDCLKTYLPTSANLLQTLNKPLMIPPLNHYSNKLLFLLQKRQKSLKKDIL